MTRMDFLKQLEYLLQDIDEKDREDALEYYRDYMDEAGISEFAAVDGLLDSPEKIAISIRASLIGDSEEQSEFSEQGVKDARWEPQKHMPDVYKGDDWSEAKSSSESKGRSEESHRNSGSATGKKGVIEVMRETSGEMRTGTVREEYLSGEILWGKSF